MVSTKMQRKHWHLGDRVAEYAGKLQQSDSGSGKLCTS